MSKEKMMRGKTMAEEKKVNETEMEEETVEETVDTPEEKEADPEAEIKALSEEANKWKTEYYKVFADMENTKKRMNTEFENQKKFMMQSFVEELLPVIDNFERSLAAEAGDENLKNFLKGYQMIHDQLLMILEKNGVKAIEAEGKPFDPNFHQAVMTEEVEGMEPNMVVEELQKGYMLKDRVVRATLVKVSQ
jgi:molecular chaperone GrpE